MQWMGKTSILVEPSNTSWSCPRDGASILTILGVPEICRMPHTEAQGPGVFPLIKEEFILMGTENQDRRPCPG
jgi:hypothetical protein